MLSSNGSTWREEEILLIDLLLGFLSQNLLAIFLFISEHWNASSALQHSYFLFYKCYLLRGYQPEQSPVEVDLLLQLLRREERPFAQGASRLHRRKGYVEDGALYVSVVLDVEHEHRLPFGGEHSRHALKEEAEQGGQEALLGHVLQTHRDAVGQHVVRDDGDTQRADGHDAMDTIWKKDRRYLTATLSYWQLQMAVKRNKTTN